ncbi:rRNA methyltransferase 2 like protein [Argiope bruennichi]|uniref:rRNA methyltransferase 2, mitochondrial n=1 Tax=Argiope bruennichi TaxID=94029 RepID=A0A8T0FXS2_ARGBR|nr:rRNA methyltransferase 2 like protein [Argiope bruennichi]
MSLVNNVRFTYGILLVPTGNNDRLANGTTLMSLVNNGWLIHGIRSCLRLKNDCGAAPGSWTQVVVNKLKLDKETADGKPRKGVAIAVDLQHIESIKGAIVIPESDFTQLEVQEKIKSFLPSGQANTILSDMAPKASGTPELDSAALMRLVYSALKFSYMVLKNNGTFVCKVWDGQDVDKFYQTLQNLFTNVKRCKPKASRSDSSELYLIATGFKRPENKI